VIDKFDFGIQIERLRRGNLLYREVRRDRPARDQLSAYRAAIRGTAHADLTRALVAYPQERPCREVGAIVARAAVPSRSGLRPRRRRPLTRLP
jgi:hypothetical protein